MPVYVFDVLLDVIHPLRARVGQVVVVRGSTAHVVRRGSTHVLSENDITHAVIAGLVVRGVIQRRTRVPSELSA